MNRHVKRLSRFAGPAFLALALVLAIPVVGAAQNTQQPATDTAKVLAAARELMEAQEYCGLVTLDESGMPQVRTMTPFAPDEQMVVWIATNPRSRKVAEIKRDARVALYYSDHTKGNGYVTLTGKAVLVDDMKEIVKRKRAYWDTSFPGLKNIVMIKVIPERLDIVNYKHGFVGAKETWRTTSIPLPVK